MGIENLEPRQVWENFSNICKIPHPSKHEAKLCAYLKKTAGDLGLETVVDKVGNLIIRKPATAGMENCRGVILQAHLDMVPQANSDVEHDFTKDPIQPYVDGEYVKAKGTTLGADNGMAIAAIMAVMQAKNLKHGPLEALLTTNEECGLDGASGLESGLLKGDVLLNLDHEEDSAVIGCAGGNYLGAKLKYTKSFIPWDSVAIKVNISGLKGGHSAVDIHLPRGNAIKIMTRLLLAASKKYPLAISSFNSGTAHNAIPREAEAVVVVPRVHEQDFIEMAESSANFIKSKITSIKSKLKIEAVKVPLPDHVLEPAFQRNLLFMLYLCPSGLLGMSVEIPGLVETSNNLGMIKFNEKEAAIDIVTFQRSSVEFIMQDVTNEIETLFSFFGAEITMGFNFSSWSPSLKSPILKLVQDKYHELRDKQLVITGTHGGLECGVIKEKYPHLDIVSIGPDIYGAHSPDERVKIKSVADFWVLLTKVLESINQL